MLRHFLGILDADLAGRAGPVDPVQPAAPTGRGAPSTAGRPTCRPPSRPTWPCAWPATPPTRRRMLAAAAWVREPRGDRRQPGVHPDLAGPARPVGLGGPAGAAARDHVPAALGAAQHLRLRLLGPPDHRGPDRRDGPPAGPAPAVRRRRAAGAEPAAVAGRHAAARARPADHAGPASGSRPRPAPLRATARLVPPPPGPAAVGPAPGRAVDRPAPGGRRAVGRDPAPGRLLDHRPRTCRAIRSTTR